VKNLKARRTPGRGPRGALRPLTEHPVIVGITVISALVGLIYTVFGPINLLPKSERRVTQEERTYLDLAEGAMRDAVALQKRTSEALQEPSRFDDSDYQALSRNVGRKLQMVREAEPSERFRTFHSNVITFLENAQESSALMGRYSYSEDRSLFNRASYLTTEGTRAMNRATAELVRLKNRQGA
jgi:hypothetical protein